MRQDKESGQNAPFGWGGNNTWQCLRVLRQVKEIATHYSHCRMAAKTNGKPIFRKVLKTLEKPLDKYRKKCYRINTIKYRRCFS